MDIYFVRHGETEYNKKHVHQPDDASLNDLGRQQAERVREKVLELKPTHIITSTHTRAVETAEIINEAGEYEVEFNELFRELERPQHIQGKKHKGLRSFWYMGQWFLGWRERYFEKKGGESRAAFLSRIKSAKSYLETLPPDVTVVIVSHSVFINFFIEHICNERPIPPKEAFELFMKILTLENTEIAHVAYNSDYGAGVCKWSYL